MTHLLRPAIHCKSCLQSISTMVSTVNCRWDDAYPLLQKLLAQDPKYSYLVVLFHRTYEQGVRSPMALESMARLALTHSDPDALIRLAKYLVNTPSDKTEMQCMACLSLLMRCRSPANAPWQFEESVLHDTVQFVTGQRDWGYPHHTETQFLYELRLQYQKELCILLPISQLPLACHPVGEAGAPISTSLYMVGAPQSQNQ